MSKLVVKFIYFLLIVELLIDNCHAAAPNNERQDIIEDAEFTTLEDFVNHHVMLIIENINEAPDDNTGRGHPFYPHYEKIAENLFNWKQSNNPIDAFAAIPPLHELELTINSSNTNAVHPRFCQGIELDTVYKYLEFTKYIFAKEISNFVKENNAEVDEEIVKIFSKYISTYLLKLGDPDWGETPPTSEDMIQLDTIDAAGIFILNPEVVLSELKKMPLVQLRVLFPTEISLERYNPEGFFERYLYNPGDPNIPNHLKDGSAPDLGMSCLRVKYQNNKTEIDAKYQELIQYVADLESNM